MLHSLHSNSLKVFRKHLLVFIYLNSPFYKQIKQKILFNLHLSYVAANHAFLLAKYRAQFTSLTFHFHVGAHVSSDNLQDDKWLYKMPKKKTIKLSFFVKNVLLWWRCKESKNFTESFLVNKNRWADNYKIANCLICLRLASCCSLTCYKCNQWTFVLCSRESEGALPWHTHNSTFELFCTFITALLIS